MPYDLIKELCIAVGVIGLLAVVLTVLFSSPDDKPSTIAQWSRAARQLHRDRDQGARRHERHRRIRPSLQPQQRERQHFLFLHPQRWLGVSHPINTANDYVIGPLKTIPDDPALGERHRQYQAAPEKTKKEWGEAYAKPLEEYETAIEENKTPPNTVALDPTTGDVTVQASGTGPVPTMMTGLLGLAKSGGLDGAC